MVTLYWCLGTAVVFGGLGLWIGKKGVKNVTGDVRIAAQDVQKKV